MHKEKAILHCDADNFFASVELISNPEFKNTPFAVSHDPKGRRGVILAKNQIAKKYDIKTGEATWKAIQKCPDLNILPPSFNMYKKYSKELNKIYLKYTDLVEPYSIDESWLDVTNSEKLFGTAFDIAKQIQENAMNDLELSISIGISFNKTFAKIASPMEKPFGIKEIKREKFKEILWQLELTKMFGVGKSLSRQLNTMGIFTIGELAQTDEKRLQKKLGKVGADLKNKANGYDSEKVQSFFDKKILKSISKGSSFEYNIKEISTFKKAVAKFTEEIARKLREEHLKAYTIRLTIRDENFIDKSQQLTLKEATSSSFEIAKSAEQILQEMNILNLNARLISVEVTNLTSSFEKQISLFSEDKNNCLDELDKSIDEINKKFGKDALKTGRLT